MSGIQCGCGRFLANAHAVIGVGGIGDFYISDVRGDCSRCGKDVGAGHEGETWWFSWDYWDINEDEPWRAPAETATA
jgi:hypothetical protein